MMTTTLVKTGGESNKEHYNDCKKKLEVKSKKQD